MRLFKYRYPGFMKTLLRRHMFTKFQQQTTYNTTNIGKNFIINH